MHPVIRLASFILLTAGLARINTLFFSISVLTLSLLCKKYCVITALVSLLKRLRWLFLSLFILNVWFNNAEFKWFPEITGVLIAIERTVMIIAMVTAAHILNTTTSTTTLVAALNWWFNPLIKMGVPTQRLAVRVALILDTLDSVQDFYPQNSTVLLTTHNPIKKISQRVTQLLIQVHARAETEPLRTLNLPYLPSPPLWQWIYPLFISVIILSG